MILQHHVHRTGADCVSTARWRAATLLAGVFFVLAQAAAADLAPTGRWQTYDDKTKKARGIVRIWEEKSALFGRIEGTVDPEEAKKVCDKCPGDRKNRPVVGLLILRNMKKKADEYTGGDILDPDNGSVYRCTMHLTEEGRKLVVRGYIGFSLLGRSQYWVRLADAPGTGAQ